MYQNDEEHPEHRLFKMIRKESTNRHSCQKMSMLIQKVQLL